MGEVNSHGNRGIMVESSSPNIAHRHQFTQEDEAVSSIKPTTTVPEPQPSNPPLTPAIIGDAPAIGPAPVNVSASTANTDYVALDEEESFDNIARSSSLGDDPYVYSDDSASLSDAYFFPQSDEEHLARPPRYRNEDAEAARTALLQYPLANYYGSMHSASVVQERATSPLWIDGSIQEDSEMPSMFGKPEVASMLLLANNDPRAKGRKERRRQQRRHKHKRNMLKQNSVNRERAVTAIRGRLQDPTKAHDVIWAVLFLLQLLAVILCAIRFGYVLLFAETDLKYLFWKHVVPWYKQPFADTSIQYNVVSQEMQYADDVLVALKQTAIPNEASSPSTTAEFAFTIDYQNVIALVSITGLYSCVITYLSVGFMLVLARALIQIMLVFSVLLALAWGLIGLTLDPYGVISILGFTALLLTLGYTMYNWSSIPFAATNLYTALCAIRCTAGITILGFVSLLAAFSWCVIWGLAFIGIVNSLNNVECDHKDACEAHVANRHIPLYLLLLFSFHWTNTVIKNVTRVTVASVVGTWWFYPGDIGPFCTPVVVRPLLRSLTKSLGSICLGSLVVQPAQAMLAISSFCWCVMGNHESSCMNHQQHDSPVVHDKRGSVLVSHGDDEVESAADSVGLFRRLCGLMDSLSDCLQSCNRWSFTYIGMCK
jgi:Plasma-membrane choline transporter